MVQRLMKYLKLMEGQMSLLFGFLDKLFVYQRLFVMESLVVIDDLKL